MSPDVQSVLDQALLLPTDQQIALIDALTVATAKNGELPFDPSWIEEVERRLANYDSGLSKAIPWDEVRAEGLRRLGQ